MFENTLKLVDDAGLSYLHVFPFSPRKGTPAARMPQLAEAARERTRRALAREGRGGAWRRICSRWSAANRRCWSRRPAWAARPASRRRTFARRCAAGRVRARTHHGRNAHASDRRIAAMRDFGEATAAGDILRAAESGLVAQHRRARRQPRRHLHQAQARCRNRRANSKRR